MKKHCATSRQPSRGKGFATGRSIKSYMAGVRHLHISEGYGDPFSPGLYRLHYVLRGVKRAEGMADVTKRERRPVTPDLLRKIKGVWDPRAGEADVVMLWAACCLAYFGFMRIGELIVPSDGAYDASAHLSWGDITVDDPACPSRMEVRIKASKTDPSGRVSPSSLARWLPTSARCRRCWLTWL